MRLAIPRSAIPRSAVAVVLAAVALTVACTGSAPAPEVPPAVRGLVAHLQEGGHVLFLRHAATDATVPAGGDDPAADCSRQRNLTGDGREDAAAFGDALRALQVPVSEVRASPLCRTLDTALLAFGDEVIPDDRLLPQSGAGGAIAPDAPVRALLALPTTGNRVLVGHHSTVANLVEVHLEEGEAAVLRVGSDGDLRLVGRLSTTSLGVSPGGG